MEVKESYMSMLYSTVCIPDSVNKPRIVHHGNLGKLVLHTYCSMGVCVSVVQLCGLCFSRPLLVGLLSFQCLTCICEHGV